MNFKLSLGGLLLLFPLVALAVCGLIWLSDRSLLIIGLLVTLCVWFASAALVRSWLRETARSSQAAMRVRGRDPRDRLAWKLIEDYEAEWIRIPKDELNKRSTQEQLVIELAQRLAKHYYPETSDPLAPLTPAEILRAARYLLDDLENWLGYYIPGGRQLTVQQLRQVSRLPTSLFFISQFLSSSLTWLRSGRGNRTGPILRTAEHAGSEKMQHAAIRLMVRKLGACLIELYSGRFQSSRFRGGERANLASDVRSSLGSKEVTELTLVVVGEPYAARMSLIRMLLGSNRARSDRLPNFKQVSRYRVQLDRPLARLVVLDSGLSIHALLEGIPEWFDASTDMVLILLDEAAPVAEVARAVRALRAYADRLAVLAILRIQLERVVAPSAAAASEVNEASLWERARAWEEKLDGVFESVVPLGVFSASLSSTIEPERIKSAILQELSPEQAAVFWQATEMPV